MTLSRRDASIVMGMLKRGDHNHDIAAWFGENPGRIDEIKKGTYGNFGLVEAAPADELPPKGAIGPKARRFRAYVAGALETLEDRGASGLGEAIKELQDGLRMFDANSS